jgi:DNA-binding transcriptional MerR regulator
MNDAPPSYAEILENLRKRLEKSGRHRKRLMEKVEQYVEDEMKPLIKEAREWGMTDVEISAATDVTRKTLRQWKEKDNNAHAG